MPIRQFLTVMACMCFAAEALAQTDEAAKPIRLRVSAGVAEGLKIHNAQPEYPREARKKGIAGDVILRATIDTKGNMVNLNPVQGDPILVKGCHGCCKEMEIPALYFGR
jgi:hypothetical protein